MNVCSFCHEIDRVCSWLMAHLSLIMSNEHVHISKKGVCSVSLVDVSSVSAPLFILGIVFIMLVFGLLSFGILRMFQQRFRTGWFSFGGAVVSFAVFMFILNKWYL